PTTLYTLSLHDALPIYPIAVVGRGGHGGVLILSRIGGQWAAQRREVGGSRRPFHRETALDVRALLPTKRYPLGRDGRRHQRGGRSEEHTSELQSRGHLV